MIALAMILAFLGFALGLSWLAGMAARDAVATCNQRCRQGRDCGCGATMERQP